MSVFIVTILTFSRSTGPTEDSLKFSMRTVPYQRARYLRHNWATAPSRT